MYRVLIISPLAVVFLLVLGGGFYRSLIKVDPRIASALENKDLLQLKSFSKDANFNWYQSSTALEYYARLTCTKQDLFLKTLLRGENISSRRAIYSGCYARRFEEVAWVLDFGLRDGYSYNRFQSLEYLSRSGRVADYGKAIEMRLSDSSSMVRIRAKELLDLLEKNRSGQSGN